MSQKSNPDNNEDLYLLTQAWSAYQEEMSSRNDADYAVDEGQMKKLMAAYAVMADLAAKMDGTVDDIVFKPSAVHCGITAYFYMLYLSGEDMKRFASVVDDMLSLSIDAEEDGRVCISFNIPDVYVKIN